MAHSHTFGGLVFESPVAGQVNLETNSVGPTFEGKMKANKPSKLVVFFLGGRETCM